MKSIALICFILLSSQLFGQVDKLQSFESDTDEFLSTYVNNGFVDYELITNSNTQLNELVENIADIKLTNFNDAEKQSFYINAYNILVIDQIIKHYPVSSVKEIPGFFNRTRYEVAGKNLTLDGIEKDILLKEYKDSRFHFALICGAKDCPKMWNHAYTADILNKQLDEQSKRALNDPSFLKVSENKIGLSEIFKWNRFEFNGERAMLEFINFFRAEPISLEAKTYYYDYDWTLNDVKFSGNLSSSQANNSFRYVTSAAIPKGGIEIKIFNNLYSQIADGPGSLFEKSTYLTSSISFLYGKSNRLNVGFVSRYRRVLNTLGPSSPLDVLKSQDGLNARSGFTAFGPQIRWAPFEELSNFSIQSSLTIPLRKGLSGGVDSPFLDWSGPVFLTQFFNDKSIGDKFSLFTELDLLVEEIGGSGKSNRVSLPVTGIFSWFPKKNVTLYGLVGYSPYLVKPYDYFVQLGIGAKYQISRNFEIEILATDFSNRFLNNNNGEAATYNIGFRYSR